jgi:transcriptional regulator with XRE-family HTH domain
MGIDAESTIGDWIRHELAHRDWTAADLARRLGVSSGRISEWSSGRYTPSPASCLRLAEVFAADPDQVLALAGHRAAPPAPEDAKARLIALIQRVEMTPTQIAGLEAMLTAWADAQRTSPPGSRKG